MARTRLVVDVWVWVLAVAVIWWANHVGWWWFTAIIGLAIGLSVSGGGRKAVLAVLAGGLGWLLPLVWQARTVPIASASSMLAGVMGFGTSNGWIVWVLTGMFGLLLCLAATWLGSAIRGVRGYARLG